jgi:hypothetical protein
VSFVAPFPALVSSSGTSALNDVHHLYHKRGEEKARKA